MVKKQKLTFKKIIGKIHLWLGLASGILVVFLGITGCMLVFEKEIEEWTNPLSVAPQQQAFALPSQLKAAAEKSLGNNRILNGIEFPGRDRSAIAYYYNATEYYQVLLTQGILMGLGLGCLYLPAPAVVSQYFHRHAALAIGASSTGSALGLCCFSIGPREINQTNIF